MLFQNNSITETCGNPKFSFINNYDKLCVGVTNATALAPTGGFYQRDVTVMVQIPCRFLCQGVLVLYLKMCRLGIRVTIKIKKNYKNKNAD